MPWILYRYIFKDMVKMLVTASAVLVLVISFAAAIKPLSEGLLGPAALLKYVLYLSPSMLGFILPFAGAFASTLTFTRMVNDNELVVCRASGLSYRAILVPVVFLGVMLTLGQFYLSNWVVPSFYRQAEHMLEKDVVEMIVNQVGRMRPVALGNMVLYADAVDDSQPPPVIPGHTVQPAKLIRLRGVAVGQTDDQGKLRSDSTAEAADVLLYRVEGKTWVTMQLKNVVYYDAVKGDLFAIEQWSLPQVLLPSPVRDDPRFLSWPEVRQLRQEPERYDQIGLQKQELAQAIAGELLLRQVEASAVKTKRTPNSAGASLIGAHGQEWYVITAPRAGRHDKGLVLGASGAVPVRVEYRRNDQLTRRIEAKEAWIWTEPGDPQPEPWVRIELKSARVYDVSRQEKGSELDAMMLPRARWPYAVLEPLSGYKSGKLLSLANQDFPQSKAVQQAGRELRALVFDLSRKVAAQLHERAALAVACLLVLLLGAVLSMKISGSLPLVIYFWSFLSAIVVVVISHSGENMAGQAEMSRALGLSVMWLGNLLLLLAVGVTYAKLARN